MARVKHTLWTLATYSVLAAAAPGCSGSSSPADDGGGISSETLSCTAPSCCVPVDINPSKITVYQLGGQIEVGIILDVPEASSNAWSASVDVSLSWGPSVTCTTEISNPAGNVRALVCPMVNLDNTPACDSALTLELHPHTSTYTDTTGTQVVCAGKQDTHVQFAATMQCPTCPNLSESSMFQACDFPNMTCYYSATASNGTTGQLPCNCTVNGVYGDLRWSCAVY